MSRLVKSVTDRLLAAVGLVVLSPVYVGISAWIRRSRGGR